MDKGIVRQHNFEIAKQKIKKFSESKIKYSELQRVEEDRLIFFDRNVTGAEVNRLTRQIQTNFHDLNTMQIKLVKEFGEVYNALEALDEDYIKAILSSLKATEKTSEGLKKTQGQLKRVVDSQVKTIQELKRFKVKLDSYGHLKDIDSLWSEQQVFRDEIEKLYSNIEANEQALEEINEVKNSLNNLDNILNERGLESQQLSTKLDLMYQYIYSITHLNDVDPMWEKLEENIRKLEETKQRVENNIISAEGNTQRIDSNISQLEKKLGETVEELQEKVKYGYWIVGSAVIIAIASLILLFMKGI